MANSQIIQDSYLSKARTKRTCTTSENGKVGGKDGQSREKNGEKIEMEKIINKGKKREVRI